LHNSQINLAGAQQVNVVKGSIGGNNFNGDSFLFGDLFDVLGDPVVGPFRRTARDGNGKSMVMKKRHPDYDDQRYS
jgi:hypothetical protein